MLIRRLFLVLIPFLVYSARAQSYPDQHYVMWTDSMASKIVSNSGIRLSDDGKSFMLEDGQTSGSLVLAAETSEFPFNRGLPSWNGTAPDLSSSFMIKMRFPYNGGWSPWLTVGFWKNYIWNSYGATSYGGGEIDYDYVVLDDYQSSWQFQIIMTRNSAQFPSPTLHKLSFFLSDNLTTSSINIDDIVNDNPDEILISTDFLYQYSIDPEIGPRICSPTSVSMILRSYQIEVDPLQFAIDTQDPYYGIFGIWPRVVQNASEFGLDGAVTRYRTWSETYDVLAAGGRIAISVGPPLYTGHLMMLAGFSSEGNPLVHDPARSNGYAYEFDKRELSRSWFEKGGVAYTFFPADSSLVPSRLQTVDFKVPEGFNLAQNYPNPFNPVTAIRYQLSAVSQVNLSIYNLLGQKVATLVDQRQMPGLYQVRWNAAYLPSGTYLILLNTGGYQQAVKAVLMK